MFVCLFVCLVHRPRKPRWHHPTRDEPYATRRPRALEGRQNAFLFVRRIPTPPLVGYQGNSNFQGSHAPQNGRLSRSCARAELGVFVAVLRSGGPRFVRLVPHRTTPHSQLLNLKTLVVSLLLQADFFLVVSLLIEPMSLVIPNRCCGYLCYADVEIRCLAAPGSLRL